MARQKSFSALPKLPKQTVPNKTLGPGSFGPIVAPRPAPLAPGGIPPIAGGIVSPKTRIPKMPKITRKPPKLIKQAPPSYL